MIDKIFTLMTWGVVWTLFGLSFCVLAAVILTWKDKKMAMMIKVDEEKCSFEGPFECEACGGHIMIDASFLEQVTDVIKCPYCGLQCQVEE